MELELKRINKENDLEKLKYLYFEFFNKTPTDDLNIYKELLKTINTNLTNNPSLQAYLNYKKHNE